MRSSKGSKRERDKIHTQQALLFLKAVERIFKEGFCPILVLDILAQIRATTSALQHQEEEKRTHSFRTSSAQNHHTKPQTTKTIHHQG
jgi:hypothetical protein